MFQLTDLWATLYFFNAPVNIILTIPSNKLQELTRTMNHLQQYTRAQVSICLVTAYK
jgi:hypothetical protein